MNRKLAVVAVVLALPFATPAPAQEEGAAKDAKTTKAVSVAFSVKTADMMVGMGLASNFDPELQLPDIGAKEHYILTPHLLSEFFQR